MKLDKYIFTNLIIFLIQIVKTNTSSFSTTTTATATATTSTDSENKLKDKINISQRFLKSKAKKSNTISTKKNLNKITKKNLNTNTFTTDNKFQDKKILMKGWIKYFKINLQNSDKKNKNFIINFQYGEQFKLFDNMEMNERGSEGNFRYIRNKYNFWAILLNDSLNILSSRDVNIFILF